MAGSTCKIRKGIEATVEYAVHVHPATVLENSEEKENGWVTDGVEMCHLGVLPPFATGRRERI